MNSSRLLYAYHLDRDYFVPFLQMYQPAYGVAILPLHCVAFYLLLAHTHKWARTIKTGYLLTQSIMFTHDVWTCFFFRAYAFLPNPIAMCMGFACEWIGPHAALASYTRVIEHFFMIHSISFFLFSLLMMHQQVAKIRSSYVIPKWVQKSAIALVYGGLWVNFFVAMLSSGDVPNAQAIIQRQQLAWLKNIKHVYLMVFGEVGNCGPYRYEVYVIVTCIIIIIPIRAILVGSTVRLLRKHSPITSRAMQMRKLYITVLLRQTAIVSVFYIYPLLLTIIAFRFQIAYMPDYLLALFRGSVIAYTCQTIPQFYALVSSNKPFQKVLASKLCSWRNNRTSLTTISIVMHYKMWTVSEQVVQLYTFIEKLHVVSGLICNSLLLFLIIYHSKKSLGYYKYLLQIFASFDIFLILIHSNVNHQVVSVGTTFASVSWSYRESRHLTSLYCASFTVPFILMIIHFLYRYWAVQHPSRISWFSNNLFIVLLVAVNISGFLLWYLICVYGATGAIDEPGTIVARAEYKRRYRRTLRDGFIVMDHWRDGKMNWRAAIVMFSLDSILLSSMVLASFLAMLTIRCIARADKLSVFSKALQRQLLMTLIVQTSLPVFFVYIPYFFILTCPFFDFPDFGVATGCTAMNSGFPTWDALVVIILMRDYREGLLRIVGGVRKIVSKQMAGSEISNMTVAVSFVAGQE